MWLPLLAAKFEIPMTVVITGTLREAEGEPGGRGGVLERRGQGVLTPASYSGLLKSDSTVMGL